MCCSRETPTRSDVGARTQRMTRDGRGGPLAGSAPGLAACAWQGQPAAMSPSTTSTCAAKARCSWCLSVAPSCRATSQGRTRFQVRRALSDLRGSGGGNESSPPSSSVCATSFSFLPGKADVSPAKPEQASPFAPCAGQEFGECVGAKIVPGVDTGNTTRNGSAHGCLPARRADSRNTTSGLPC